MGLLENLTARGFNQPILYLPLKDSATATQNLGTGGNFTANGTFATSNRGANQDNCKASYFDGVADYLSRTSLTGVADGKQFTFSCSFKVVDTQGSNAFAFRIGASSGYTFGVYFASNKFWIVATGVATIYPVSSIVPSVNTPITHILSISIDTSDVNKTRVFIDNIPVSLAISTFVNSVIDFTNTHYSIGCGYSTTPNGFMKGNIGELYFDTKYIDLATSNPFWDSVENKPVPVRKVIADTSVVPLIAMPLDASNAGKNYGTGGDFTANSAPYVGARGASEFWARRVNFGASASNYLTKSESLSIDSNSITILFSFKPSAFSNSDYFISIGRTVVWNDAQSRVRCDFIDTNGNSVRTTASNVNSFVAGTEYIVSITYNNGTVDIRINGVTNIGSAGTYSGGTPNISKSGFSTQVNNSYYGTGTDYIQGDFGFVYVANSFIDFSQEVNRLKFVDAFNMPLDLGKQIDKGIIPKPLIYLPFDDPTNLGKNLGTGGNFTVNGTITQGADVNG